MFWHSIWLSCGKPNCGVVYEIRKKTRAEYHRAVRMLKRDERINRCEKMAQSIVQNDNRNFWQEVKKMNKKESWLPDTVDGVTGNREIADMFGSKYKKLYNSAPYDADVMRDIDQVLNERMTACSSDDCVKIDDVKKAVSFMKKGKSDGNDMIESDHIINGSNLLHELLCLLIQKCYDHSYMPYILNIANIVSIPKDNRGSMIKGDNYRGIGLCSSIVKLMEIIIYMKSQGTLETNGLQFAYKKDHSTTMCTGIMKEAVRYYKKNGSTIYCCLLDASKAFDRVRLDKLFKLLLERKFPPKYIKFLMNTFFKQRIRVKWGNNFSETFKGVNGIRQGGVISPLLFTVYIDVLIERLEKSNAGCFLGHKFVGCGGFADDVELISPSVTGLQKMVTLCEEFGIEYDVLFNEKKSICIMFDNVNEYPDIVLNGKSLMWSKKAKHVGNVLNCDLTDEDDILYKKQEFFQQVNRLLADYGDIRHDILRELFAKKCNSFYGSQIWDLRSKHVESLLTAWNKGARRMLKLPYNSHRYLLPELLNMVPIKEQLCKRFLKMCYTMSLSENKTLSFVYKFCINDKNSNISRNMFYISKEYDFKPNTYCLGYKSNLFNMCQVKKVLNENQVRNCQFLKELLEIRDGHMNVMLDKDEIHDIIDFISTS